MHGGDVAHIDVAGGANGWGNGGNAAGKEAPDGLQGFIEIGGRGRRLDWGAGDDGGVDGVDCEGGLMAISSAVPIWNAVSRYRPCARL